MLRGSGPALAAAAAAAAREEISLPCHRVPAEEGEGRDAAFPVPPAWLDLRGLRLPGNSKAAAGPGSARGLLVGSGPELFGTPSLGEEAFQRSWQMWTPTRCWSGCRWGREMKGTCS